MYASRVLYYVLLYTYMDEQKFIQMCMYICMYIRSYIPSSSSITTSALDISPRTTPYGRESGSMETLNVSLSSNFMLSTIRTSKLTRVTPPGNKTCMGVVLS